MKLGLGSGVRFPFFGPEIRQKLPDACCVVRWFFTQDVFIPSNVKPEQENVLSLLKRCDHIQKLNLISKCPKNELYFWYCSMHTIIFVNFRAFEFPTERCLAIAYVYNQSFMQHAHELRFVQEVDQRLFFSCPQSSLWLFSLMSFLSIFGFCFAFSFSFFFYYSLYLVQLSLLRLYYNKIYNKLTKRDVKWREYRCKTH